MVETVYRGGASFKYDMSFTLKMAASINDFSTGTNISTFTHYLLLFQLQNVIYDVWFDFLCHILV